MKPFVLLILVVTAAPLLFEERAVLTCAGDEVKEHPGDNAKAYRLLFEKAGRSGLSDLMKEKETGLALQAVWEFHKKIFKRSQKPARGPEETYDPAEMKKFVEFLKDRTKSPVPDWWQTAISDLAVTRNQSHMYFGFDRDHKGLEEVKLGEYARYVKKGVVLTQNDNVIKYTSGNVTLEVPKPKGPENLLGGNCLIDITSGKTTCLAAYTSVFARSFRCAGFDSKSGKRVWDAKVWALASDVHTGPTAGHRAEFATKGDTVFVFGEEFGGLYLEAFDLASGKCQFRFCTTYWGDYSEGWNLELWN